MPYLNVQSRDVETQECDDHIEPALPYSTTLTIAWHQHLSPEMASPLAIPRQATDRPPYDDSAPRGVECKHKRTRRVHARVALKVHLMWHGIRLLVHVILARLQSQIGDARPEVRGIPGVSGERAAGRVRRRRLHRRGRRHHAVRRVVDHGAVIWRRPRQVVGVDGAGTGRYRLLDRRRVDLAPVERVALRQHVPFVPPELGASVLEPHLVGDTSRPDVNVVSHGSVSIW